MDYYEATVANGFTGTREELDAMRQGPKGKCGGLKKPDLEVANLIAKLAHLYLHLDIFTQGTPSMSFKVTGESVQLTCNGLVLEFTLEEKAVLIKTKDAGGFMLQTAIGALNNMGGIEDHVIQTFRLN